MGLQYNHRGSEHARGLTTHIDARFLVRLTQSDLHRGCLAWDHLSLGGTEVSLARLLLDEQHLRRRARAMIYYHEPRAEHIYSRVQHHTYPFEREYVIQPGELMGQRHAGSHRGIQRGSARIYVTSRRLIQRRRFHVTASRRSRALGMFSLGRIHVMIHRGNIQFSRVTPYVYGTANMPEGVEVRLFAEDIYKLIRARELVAVRAIAGRYVRDPPAITLPARVKSLGTRGKLMWWEMSTGERVLFTLGLAGAWADKQIPAAKMEFVFAAPQHDDLTLWLVDFIGYATVTVTTADGLASKLNKMGVDMFSPMWTQRAFVENLRAKPAATIAASLLSQRVVAGPGAYIIAESLFAAKIAPTRKIQSMSDADIARVYNAVRKIAADSYTANRGHITISCVDKDVKHLNVYKFNVYGRDHDPAGNPVNTVTVGSRRIKWVPAVQV